MGKERRNHSICYTATTYEVHTFKNESKRTSLRDVSVYHFLFCIYLFVSRTRAYDIAHDGDAMSSDVILTRFF